jgi:hypothetical protein
MLLFLLSAHVALQVPLLALRWLCLQPQLCPAPHDLPAAAEQSSPLSSASEPPRPHDVEHREV